MSLEPITFSYLREQIVGIDSTFETPFGQRLMVYCDYAASGRCLAFVETYLQTLESNYANTHTEDDVTGRNMTQLLHQAERIIKESVNAGPHGRIIACGSGATGAIEKFQQLVGVRVPPATQQMIDAILGRYLERDQLAEWSQFLKAYQPVVFVGPYEHHSNEISWRQGLATVVEVELTDDGGIDLGHLRSLLQDSTYEGRLRVGSFSAASNVTGMRSPVHDIARLLHQHKALACFDFSASAPYVEIDMNPEPGLQGGDPSLDAVYLSPHKFLGGPGSSGILLFNERIYHRELGPSLAAGGTVSYVGPSDQDFVGDIEERERAGTPGVLQTMKAALAFQVKEALTVAEIEARELELTAKAMGRWKANPNIEILGNPDPSLRLGIVSFNIKDPRGRYLHPKFITSLLNDLFGIQSRAGCSCAGPYGHRLLKIDHDLSENYRKWVRQGYLGIKPGWCRVGFHFAMDDPEADYVIDTIDFVANYGYLFLSLYRFDLKSGAWTHQDSREKEERFSLESALQTSPVELSPLKPEDRLRLYDDYLQEAQKWAQKLRPEVPSSSTILEGEIGALQFFSI